MGIIIYTSIIFIIALPLIWNHSSLKSEYDPLKALSVNSKFAVIKIIIMHLLKKDIIKRIYFLN